MKTCTALVALFALVALIPLRSVFADPAAAPPFPVVSQTAGGLTLRITGARWQRLLDLVPNDRPAQQDVQKKVFAVTFQLTRKPSAAASSSGAPEGSLRAWAVTPDGVERPGVLLQSEQDGAANTTPHESTVIWYNVDPRWDPMTVGFELTDPAAPQGANGLFQTALEFKEVPLPPKDSPPVALNLAAATPHGTRVVLDKALWSRQFGRDPRLLLGLRLIPSETPSDLSARFDARTTRVEDGAGTPPGAGWSHGYRDSDVQEGDRIDPPDKAGKAAGSRYTVVASGLSPEAKTAHVSLSINERAPSLKQEKWFRRFEFKLKRSDIALPPAGPPVTPVSTEEIGDKVKLTLESLQADTAYGGEKRYAARIFLEDPKFSEDPHREWLLEKVHWYSGGQGRASDEQNVAEPPSPPWRGNSVPLKPGETGYEVPLTMRAFKTLPANLNIETDWLQVSRTHYDLDFSDLPLPKPGETLPIDQSVALADLGQCVAKKIVYFDAAHPLPDPTDSLVRYFQPPSGIAVLLEFHLRVPEPGPVSFHFREWRIAARDDQGRAFGFRPDNISDRNGDATVGGTEDGKLTLFLLPPAPDAKKLRLHLHVLHYGRGGNHATVVFPNVPLQPFLPAP